MLAMSIYIGTRGVSFDITIICFVVLLAMFGAYFLLSKKYFTLKYRWILTLFSVLLILLSGYMIGYEYHNLNSPYNEQEYDKSSQISSITVKDLIALDKELNVAKNLHKPVMLNFTASWCLACKELNVTTFKNKDVMASLKGFKVIEVDITSNDANAKALMRRFNVMAPPTLIFIDKNGYEIKNKSILGFISSEKLLSILKSI
jgi:thiol:disulfide interchange protein DsbD